MNPGLSTRNIALIAGAAVIGLIGFSTVYVLTNSTEEQFASCGEGAVAGGQASIGGPFELLNAAGELVTDRDVITKPTLLYFGYTFCPDVCPLDTVRNADTVDLLAERGYDVQTVFISVDSARDTPEVMGDFTSNIDTEMIGLTGSPEQISAAVKAYRAYYNIHEAEDEYYLIDHSTFTYLVFPETGFAGFFRRDLSEEQLADKVACYLDQA